MHCQNTEHEPSTIRALTQKFSARLNLLHFLIPPAAAQVVAGVAIIMLGAGIPLAFALLLRRNRHRLYEPRVYSSFGLLYEGLSVERGTYAWTSIDMVKKILVVLIASLIKSADFQQVAACVLLVSRTAASLLGLLVSATYVFSTFFNGSLLCRA